MGSDYGFDCYRDDDGALIVERFGVEDMFLERYEARALLTALAREAGAVEAEITGWHKRKKEYFMRIVDPSVDATTGKYLVIPLEDE